MLLLDQPMTINKVIVYRDHSNEKMFYYLPRDVRIARDEKSLHFTIYTDGQQDTEKLDTSDIRRFGGLLNMDAVMGPTDAEYDAVKKELQSIAGSDVILNPVSFEDGTVRLAMFGKESETNKDVDPTQIWYAGSTKPSLIGDHQATFNLKVGDKESQIVNDLLNNTPQTQMAVMYDMDYLGVMPAYNLEITVDFKATEQYYENHLTMGVDVDVENVKVMTDIDVDSVIRDMLDEGTIIIKETDLTENKLYLTDMNKKIELVKQLLGEELFSPTPLPVADNTVLKKVVDGVADNDGFKKKSDNANNDKNGDGKESAGNKGTGTDKSTGTDKVSGTPKDGAEGGLKITDAKDGEGKKQIQSQLPEQPKGDGKGEKIKSESYPRDIVKPAQGDNDPECICPPKSESNIGQPKNPSLQGEPKRTSETPRKKDDGDNSNDENNDKAKQPVKLGTDNPGKTGPDSNTPPSNKTDTPQSPNTSETGNTTTPETEVDTEEPQNPDKPDGPKPENTTESGKPDVTDDDEKETEKEEATTFSVGVNIGYTLKHHKLTEQVKRTFTFNRQEVKRCHFYSSGIIATGGEGSKFDPTKQVYHVKLGVGVFHETNLTFGSAINFAEYGISNAVVSWRFEDSNVVDSVLLDAQGMKKFRSMMHNDSLYPKVIYKVEYALQSDDRVSTAEMETESRFIQVGINDLVGKQFVKLVAGDFSQYPKIVANVYPDGDNTKMKSCMLEEGNEKVALLIDTCESYDVELVYNRKGSAMVQRVIHRHVKGDSYVVNNPLVLKVDTILESSTFDGDIVAVMANVSYNGSAAKKVVLTKTKLQADAYLDYEDDAQLENETVKVEYQIVRNGGKMENPIVEEFGLNDETLKLSIFSIVAEN